MKILVTGAGGFIGKNLIAALENLETPLEKPQILAFGRRDNPEILERYVAECDFVYHLAGVNRPENDEAFARVNTGLTQMLLELLEKHNNQAPVLLASSVHAETDTAYGKSKREAESLLVRYGREKNVEIFIYRLPNVFGKWARPHYNSVVATFCHQISRGLPVRIDDPGAVLRLVYIDDVVKAMLGALNGQGHELPEACEITVGGLAEKIRGFKKAREALEVPNMAEPLTKKLYATYLTYLPVGQLNYLLDAHRDARGAFAEFVKTPDRGQVSVNISKAGVTRGEHWHHTKNEKFLVVRGRGRVRLRKLGSQRILEYPLSGERLEVLDIPAGYVHAIVNDGDEELITLIWACEAFDPQIPDTYPLRIECGREEGESNEKTEGYDHPGHTA
ncbi:NAD-dependent epimerase/dehydratase family protein [Eubacterium sp. 1001713B170207_170306_E7]|uniref:polysaccharide biosynthesis C-terminal domain-containing protein n=1 Tax=Eubacterium sp. 1001713B170207_170306_E7 TaxID=2787097 RepID=UPI00189A6A62|nr:NAD-dependent epimerase/dehydratase family protein [Eubacterium sp. 1001713B170207_170306_E7]